jgi:hypothetical protein
MHISELAGRDYGKVVNEQIMTLAKGGLTIADALHMEIPADHVEGEHVMYSRTSASDELFADGHLLNVGDFHDVCRIVRSQNAFGTRVFKTAFHALAEPLSPFTDINEEHAGYYGGLHSYYIRTQSLVDHIDQVIAGETVVKYSARGRLILRAVIHLEEVEEELELAKQSEDHKTREQLR